MNRDQGKKKIVLINTVLYGSTGNIVRQLKSLAEDHGMRAFTVSAFARNSTTKYDENDIVIGNLFDRYLHLWLSRTTGLSGTFSVFSTRRLIRHLEGIRPDVIHLHNLHNAYINLPILFSYIKKNNIKVIWTLHDCWAFTGRCPHYEMVGCEKWKTGCRNCPYPADHYPVAYKDRSHKMWEIKKKAFTGVQDMVLVTPSKWLTSQVKESFLKEYPIETINNGIDLEVFKPVKAYIYEELKASGKHLVLGLAMDWSERKGLDVFVELSRVLGDEYQIVLVGTDDNNAAALRKHGIRCINRTSSQQELAEIYTAADVFVNPTREDTFPTVNIEALACGTPVITFDTGGSPEMLDQTCGIVVAKDDMEALKTAVRTFCEETPFCNGDCMKRAKLYEKEARFKEYLGLYAKTDIKR